MKISGKSCLVVGGASGIGKATCIALLNKGAKVVIADIDGDNGPKTVAELNSKFSNNVAFAKCDIGNEAEVKAAFTKAEKFGKVEIVVNTASIIDEFDWKKCVEINLGGVINLTTTCMERMGKDKGGLGGCLTQVTSIGALSPLFWGPIYTATKHAVIGYLRSWAMPENYEKHGIRMNSLCPTVVDTPFVQQAVKTPHAKLVEDFIKSVDKLTPEYVAEGLIQMVEDDKKNGEAMRISKEKGYDFASFPQCPKQ